MRWVWPDPHENSGAALWLPPNIDPDVDQLIELLQNTGSDGAKIELLYHWTHPVIQGTLKRNLKASTAGSIRFEFIRNAPVRSI